MKEINRWTCAFSHSVELEHWNVEAGEELECLYRRHPTSDEDLATVFQTEHNPDFLVNESICQ